MKCECGPKHHLWSAGRNACVDWDTLTLYHGRIQPCGGDLDFGYPKIMTSWSVTKWSIMLDWFYDQASPEYKEWIDGL